MFIFWLRSPIHLKRKIIVQAFLEKAMLVFRVPGNRLMIFQESKAPALASNMKLFCSACHSMTSWLTQRDNKTSEGHKGEPHYLWLFLFCGESTWLPSVSVELFLTTFIFQDSTGFAQCKHCSLEKTILGEFTGFKCRESIDELDFVRFGNKEIFRACNGGDESWSLLIKHTVPDKGTRAACVFWIVISISMCI